MGQLGWHLLVVLFSLTFGSAGWVFATDFRGVTAWHARWGVGLTRRPTDERVARQAAQEKSIGWVFMVAAALVLLVSLLNW